jgi:predicted metalloprotease with PDZ domain
LIITSAGGSGNRWLGVLQKDRKMKNLKRRQVDTGNKTMKVSKYGFMAALDMIFLLVVITSPIFAFSLPLPMGVTLEGKGTVVSVEPGSAADRAGIQVGDLINRINGR